MIIIFFISITFQYNYLFTQNINKTHKIETHKQSCLNFNIIILFYKRWVKLFYRNWKIIIKKKTLSTSIEI